MSGIPVLKFEKSTNYLNSQLDIQLNNKHLISDIIANIGSLVDATNMKEKTSYLFLKDSANTFLKIISENITVIEELKREMKHITSDLSEVIEEINRKEKSKEYYIAAISTIKNNIENYTSKFQYFEKKLNNDNINFNEFINENNFKYNFESNPDNTYNYSGFSVENNKEEVANNEEPVSQKDIKINKLTNEFKDMLSNLSEDTVLSLDLITALKTEFSNEQVSKNEEKETLENVEEAEEESVSEDKNIVIDYSSIYKNYYNKKASTIEESISSEYSSFIPSLDAIAPILPETPTTAVSNTKEDTNVNNIDNDANINNSDAIIETNKKAKKTPFFILEDEPEEENDIIIEETKNEEPAIQEEKIIEEEPVIQEIATTEESVSEEPENILDNELTEELSNELARELLENELFGTPKKAQENIEITDEDLLNEILKEEIEKEPTIDDIILNDEELTKELLNDSSEVTNEISILDSISDDDILQQLLISDSVTDELLKDSTPTASSENNDTENLVDFCNIEEKIEAIKKATSNNDTLIISEKQKKVFLPYTLEELQKYVKTYPDIYHSEKEVVKEEFILPFDEILKHQAQSRFFEAYNLIKNKEKKSPFLAVAYGIKLFCQYKLSPAVIAACKNQKQLDSYLKCLKENKLSKFKFFKTVYQVNPL